MTSSARRSTRTSLPLMPVSMGMFGTGLLAVLAVFGLFAAGYENLPVWLNLATMLAPLGLAVGLVGAIVQARRSARRGTRPLTRN